MDLTQYIRLALDVSFVSIGILLFYMFSLQSEKYKKFKANCRCRQNGDNSAIDKMSKP